MLDVRENPFRPGPGNPPSTFLGRQGDLEEFKILFETGFGEAQQSLILGPRGIGKTTLLNEIQGEARIEKWIVIAETALRNSSLMSRLHAKALAMHQHKVWEFVTSFESFDLQILGTGGGIQRRKRDEHVQELETLLVKLLTELKKKKSGLLLLIDEIQNATAADREDLPSMIQRLMGLKDSKGKNLNLPVALTMAGLPGAIDKLRRKEASTSFLGRAHEISLLPIELQEVQQEYASTFGAAGVPLNLQLLEQMTYQSAGYPYLVQLIGQNVWRAVAKFPGESLVVNVQNGITAALAAFERAVIEVELKSMALKKQDFLLAMVDTGQEPTPLAEIIQRFSPADPKIASTYAKRLKDEGIIADAGHGMWQFVLPHLREYLKNRRTS